jgi:hypothetical protein
VLDGEDGSAAFAMKEKRDGLKRKKEKKIKRAAGKMD